MNGLLRPDGPFMSAVSRMADLAILNMLFLLCCVPVVTIGPAMTALYTVLFTLNTPREQGVLRPFFRALRSGFLPALKLWLVLLAVGALVAADLLLFSGAVRVLFLVMAAILVLAGLYTFPLAALFENTVLGTLKNALALSLGSLPRALIIAAAWLFPWFLAVRFPVILLSTAFIFVAIYFAAAAYLTVRLLRRVLAAYLPEELKEEQPE